MYYLSFSNQLQKPINYSFIYFIYRHAQEMDSDFVQYLLHATEKINYTRFDKHIGRPFPVLICKYSQLIRKPEISFLSLQYESKQTLLCLQKPQLKNYTTLFQRWRKDRLHRKLRLATWKLTTSTGRKPSRSLQIWNLHSCRPLHHGNFHQRKRADFIAVKIF